MPQRVASVGEAVESFLAGGPLPAGYVYARVGAYRALCRRGPPGQPGAMGAIGSRASQQSGHPDEPLLLAGEDGAVYLPHSGGENEEEAQALQARRLRPTTTTLALRLPAEMGGAPRVYTLWASPRYLAASGPTEELWK